MVLGLRPQNLSHSPLLTISSDRSVRYCVRRLWRLLAGFLHVLDKIERPGMMDHDSRLTIACVATSDATLSAKHDGSRHLIHPSSTSVQ